MDRGTLGEGSGTESVAECRAAPLLPSVTRRQNATIKRSGIGVGRFTVHRRAAHIRLWSTARSGRHYFRSSPQHSRHAVFRGCPGPSEQRGTGESHHLWGVAPKVMPSICFHGNCNQYKERNDMAESTKHSLFFSITVTTTGSAMMMQGSGSTAQAVQAARSLRAMGWTCLLTELESAPKFYC